MGTDTNGCIAAVYHSELVKVFYTVQYEILSSYVIISW